MALEFEETGIVFEGRPVLLRQADALIDGPWHHRLLQHVGIGSRVYRGFYEYATNALQRQPNFSFVAEVAPPEGVHETLGMSLAGHDARCGWLHSVFVVKHARRRGIGRLLVKRSIQALNQAGIVRTHAEVLREEAESQRWLVPAALRHHWENRQGTPFLALSRESFSADRIGPVPKGITIKNMGLEHIHAAIALWQKCGIPLRDKDSPEALAAFLKTNPKFCLIAKNNNGQLIATQLGGKYINEGSLYHGAVAPEHRNQGLNQHMALMIVGRLFEHGCKRVMSQVLDERHVQRRVDLGFEVINRIADGSTMLSTTSDQDMGFTLTQVVHPCVAHPPQPRPNRPRIIGI